MSVELLRKLLNSLVILSLALPGLGMRPCCCDRAANLVKPSVLAGASSLAPCCAKRLAAAQAARDAYPALKAKCCCGDLRWSQTVAKTLPTRVDEPQSGVSTAASLAPKVMVATGNPVVDTRNSGDRATIPRDVSPIALCRWQI
jgi:hypothetical protein